MSQSTTLRTEHETGAAATAVPTVSIYGISFSKLNMRDTVNHLTARIEQHIPTHVVTGNPIMVMAALESPVFDEALRSAELVVPDGTGVVWAASRVGQPVAERVAGYDLMHELFRIGGQRGWRVYLLGSTQEVIKTCAKRIAEQYPGLIVVGYRNGFFGADQDGEVISAIRQSQADLLFVARSVNTQEPWIAAHKAELGIPVMMGVGGSFDVIAGVVKRAPKLFQRLRLEWFYRLLKQPSRVGRMLVLPKFALKVMRDKENVTKYRNAL
ncbi:WecB/TagA/CpsF family glycosyltransferase [Paenibacillus methanolicus]|uniref:N-acetylglucosaminyldiphosphoundecaprenol N-acetyl-beta-D-mannosaminyltransferase n=1 Tax=Paenibacillus methanolicus TaxID=582686 RepID=A0A5S5CBH9_9BACL|nr:WecB/TagA/CpsF family glycosyltransferase [Paenibacillus methanolicus]TYP75700.1 N-acetylglucosaminyldiphosphoundecaprenol N-acetyl-beta-D-mannosaminyltransferase [Paenibacillus methanolicus]